jgi:hypothetical protein
MQPTYCLPSSIIKLFSSSRFSLTEAIFRVPSDVFVGEQKPCRSIKAASFYRLSFVVRKNARSIGGSGDRLSRCGEIFGQKCQDRRCGLDRDRLLISRSGGGFEWFNARDVAQGNGQNLKIPGWRSQRILESGVRESKRKVLGGDTRQSYWSNGVMRC